MRYVCIDGNSIINRAYFGIRLLSAPDGTYTNAVLGFLNILFKIQDEIQPDGVAIAFDLPIPTFRHKMYDNYKGNRKGMPEELAQQLPLVKEILGYMGYRILEVPGYEADDILGTFSRICEEQGHQCVIATGDRDSFQLISDLVTVRLSATNSSDMITPEVIQQKYGVTPKEMIDVKALMGDTSDCIPGVAGVGEKTALQLIQTYHTLDNVYAHLDDGQIREKLAQKLRQDKEKAYMSRELAEIVRDVPIQSDLSSYCQQQPQEAQLYQILSRLNLKKAITHLGLSAQSQDMVQDTPVHTPALKPAEFVDKMPSCSSIDVLNLGQTVYYICQNQVYCGTCHEDILRDESVQKRTFDCKSLYRHNPELKGVVFDVTLAAYLLDSMATTYDYDRLAGGVLPAFECRDNVGNFAPLAEEQYRQLEQQGMLNLLTQVEIPLAQVLSDMERVGIAVDKQGIVDFGRELSQKIEQEQSQIYQMVGYEFNINSPKQLGKALFEDLKLPHGKKTKTGYSTNVDVLNSLKDKHPVAQHILDYRSYAKLKSTYVDGLLAAIADDGRIHTTFCQTETRTGRISSIEPNIQNIPVRTALGSEMRKFFIAGSQNLLVDADYSQIELRVLAHMSNDQNMIDAFNSGKDIHTTTAAQVFHMPEEFVTPQMRRSAKAVNFGIVYGIGAFSLAGDIGVSVAEADTYIKDYLANFSGVDSFMKQTVQQAQRDHYTTTLFGRRRNIPELAAKNKVQQALGKRMAMNAPIQGTAADIIKIAMCKVWKRLKEEQLNAVLVLQVHDELIVEAAEDCAERAKEIVCQEMRQAAKLSVELKVDANIGKTWYETK